MAYLDALRGYLAIIIFTGHTCSRHWRWIPDPVLQVPWLAFPFRGGHASLDIFFWISGYVITYKMVGLMQAKRYDKVLATLASSMFRRYLRLFLPMAITTFVTVLLLATGIAVLPPHKYKEKGMQRLLDGHPFSFWIEDTAQAMNPFSHVGGWWTNEKKGRAGTTLLDQFWSINTEFRSSMLLFTFCATTCKMPSTKRTTLLWICIPLFMCWQVQWAAMAFYGMYFAERRQLAAQKEKLLLASQVQTGEEYKPSSKEKFDNRDETTRHCRIVTTVTRPLQRLVNISTPRLLSRNKESLLILLFLYSFYIIQNVRNDPGISRFPHNLLRHFELDSWAPEMKMHFHLIAGSSLMLNSLDQVACLKRPLLTPFSQYLGELSFGIYAVHITVRWIVWEPRYLKWTQSYYGKAFDHFWGIFPGWIMMTIVVLWAAELFRRMDVQVVRFCKELEDWMFKH